MLENALKYYKINYKLLELFFCRQCARPSLLRFLVLFASLFSVCVTGLIETFCVLPYLVFLRTYPAVSMFPFFTFVSFFRRSNLRGSRRISKRSLRLTLRFPVL